MQFRKSSDEVRKLKEENAAFQEKLIQSEEIKGLRKHNEELQKKLLKGAPRPRGFEIEVSERERVVLAIPDKWEPRGGILFDFTMPEELLEENDKFPARFNVTFIPITEDTLPMDDFYETYRLNTYEFADVYAHTCEQIFIG